MSTTNLNLEEIELEDTIRDSMIKKINSNMRKIDDKYGELIIKIAKKTGKDTLEEAIAYINELVNLQTLGDATSNDILPNKTALVKGKLITGNLQVIQKKVNSIALSGTYSTSTYILEARAFYEENGDVAIVIKSAKNTSYENMYFTLNSAPDGVTLDGISPYYYSSASSYGDTYVAILKGIEGMVDINIEMNSVNSSGDYVQCAITINQI